MVKVRRLARNMLLTAALVPVALVASSHLLGQGGVGSFGSLVDGKGNIAFPKEFPNGFVHIGTWAVDGADGVADTHAVYSRPSDVEQYRATGKFPDGAVLIKEVAETIGSSHTTGKAFWVAETKTWFLMIKDVKGRFPANPLWGDGWGWAQFDPKDRSRQIATNYKTDCLPCHVPAKALDWVYVYAYPTLGEKALKFTPQAARAVGLRSEDQGHRREAMNVSGTAPMPTSADNEVRAAMGKVAFQKTCSGCHSVEAGQNGTGPSLFRVIGRKAGSEPTFAYSEAMKSSAVIWSRETVVKHLTDTRGFIPGNRMGRFFAGVEMADEREAIAAYLETLK